MENLVLPREDLGFSIEIFGKNGVSYRKFGKFGVATNKLEFPIKKTRKIWVSMENLAFPREDLWFQSKFWEIWGFQ